MDSDLELPVTLLTEGFIALCDEYKALAAQHQSIERRLALSQQECDRLRQLCPAEATSSTSQDPSETEVKTSLPLSEWLDNIRRTDRTDYSDSVTRIKQAESACVQISNRLAGTRGGCPFNVAPRRQSQLPAHLSKSQYTPSLNTIPDMEEDFTTPGAKSGNLNCPFASMATPAENKDRMPPTPHSSRSQSRMSQSRQSQSSKQRAKRPSFHDPMNPSVVISSEGSRANSIAGSGPACPIRFLGQHSPEEIAKYFQEHKHELPRSHEVCVKRFQENSDDIKKLDAKYGSLVNMIQGLGQKHRPMLPAVPVFDDDDEENGDGDEYDEERDREKISKWAKSVSAVGAEPGDSSLKHRRVSDPTAQTGGEERVSHFDRPLREVRVGESPSRPWGVPIPLKYLEREDDTGSTKADTPATSVPVPAIKVRETLGQAEPCATTSKPNAKPKGSCPFNHAAMMAPGAATTTKDLDPPELPVPKIEHTSSIGARPRTYAAQTPAAAAAVGEKVEASKEQVITNNGFIVVSDGAHLKDLRLVNNGTLLIGLDAASAKGLMQRANHSP